MDVGMRKVFWLTTAVMLVAVLLLVLTPPHPRPPGGFHSPILALQFASGWPELATLLAVDRTMYWWNTSIDFVYLTLYSYLFALVGWRLNTGWARWCIAALALLAALFDACENLAILRVLPLESGFVDDMATQIRLWATLKFALLGIVWLWIGVKWWFKRLWKSAAIPYAGAGLWTLLSLLFQPSSLEFLLLLLGIALLVQWWTYRPWATRRATSTTRATTSGSSELT